MIRNLDFAEYWNVASLCLFKNRVCWRNTGTGDDEIHTFHPAPIFAAQVVLNWETRQRFDCLLQFFFRTKVSHQHTSPFAYQKARAIPARTCEAQDHHFFFFEVHASSPVSSELKGT